MPNSVDNRVVEMQFDNSKFEKNIHQSIKSLEQLDKALQLEDATKNFNKIEKTANELDLSKLDRTLERIEYRFSTLGIAGATAVQEITKSVMGLGKKLYDNTIGQIKSGGMARAMNIADAKFQLEGLGVAWEKIEEDINYGVKDTAYGLDAAAKAASQLTASGIEMGDEMKTALRGISGVAAMTNSSYEEISRIFTTVAGQGRVMGDQLNQLSARGLNAAATLGKAMNKSEAEIREMVSKGKINFQDFAKAMDDAYGAHAKDANKTFTGALSNMKAALSRIGADFATPYMDNMIRIFNSTTKLIDNVRAALKPVTKMVSDTMYHFSIFTNGILRSSDTIEFFKNAINGVVNIFGILKKLINPIAIAFKNVFPNSMLKTLANFSVKFENVTANFQLSRPIVTAVINIFEALFSVLKLGGTIISTLYTAFSPLLKLIKPTTGLIITLTGKLSTLITKIVKVVSESKTIKGVAETIGKAIEFIVDFISDIIDKIIEFIDEAGEIEIVKDIFEALSDAVKRASDSILPILEKIGLGIGGAFVQIIDFAKSGKIEKLMSNITKKGDALNDTVGYGTDLFSKLLGIFKGGFKNMPSKVMAAGIALEKTNEASRGLTNGGLIPGLSKFSDAMSEAGNTVSGFLDIIKKRASDFGVGRALIVGLSASVIALIVNCARVAGTFTRAFKGVPRLISSITKAFDASIFTMKAKVVIVGVAVAIATLAGSLALLTLVDSDKLIVATKCLGALLALMGVMGFALAAFSKFSNFKDVAFSFLGFAGAIGILTLSMKELLTIETDLPKIGKALLALGSVMALMAGVVILVSRNVKAFTLMFGAGFMLAFALSVKMLVEALKSITELNMTKLKDSLEVLLSVMGSLAAIALASTFLSPLAGVGFLAIVASFLILIKGLAMMGDVDVSVLYHVKFVFEDMLKALEGWLTIFAILYALRVVFAGLQAVKNPLKDINKGMKELGRAAEIAAVGAAFLMIAQGLYKLSEIDADKVAQAKDFAYNIGSALMLISAVFTALSVLLPKDNIFTAIGGAMQGFGVMLAGIALALKLVDSLQNPLESYLIIIGVVAVLFGFITLLTTLQAANPMIQMGVKTALALSVVLTALVLSIGLLSMIASTPGGLGAVVASGLMIALIVAAVAGALAALGTVKNWQSSLAAAVGMSAVLAAIALCFAVMKDMDAGKAWGEGLLIITMIGALSLIAYLLSKIDKKGVVTGVGAIIGIAGAIALMAVSLKVLESINFDKMLPNLIAMSTVLAIFVIIAGILAGIGVATEGIFTLALAGAAAAMVQLALSMDLIAVAAIGFSAAAVILGIAFNIIVTGLHNLATVDFKSIADGMMLLFKAALGGIGSLVPLGIAVIELAALAAVVYFLGPILEENTPHILKFSTALNAIGNSLSSFASKDLSGLAGNLVGLAGAVASLILLEPEMAIVAATLMAFGTGLYQIDNYTGNLTLDLQKIEKQMETLTEDMDTLTDGFDKLPSVIGQAINRLSEKNIVQFIADLAQNMREMSTVEMPSVGVKIANDIIDGWKEIVTEDNTEALATDFIQGIIDGAKLSESQLKALGEYIAGLVIEGARGPNGFDEHSPSKEAILEMVQFAMGLKKGAEVSQQTLDEVGQFIGKEITTETLESLENGEVDIMSWLSDMGLNLQDMMDDMNLELPITVTVDKSQLYGLYDDVDPRTVEGYDPKMASIPGYTGFYQAKGAIGVGSIYNKLKTETGPITPKGGSPATPSTDKDTKSTKKNTKAKKDNTKATKENTEATKDNSEAIKKMAEEIEVVTEKYNELNHYQGLVAAGNKRIRLGNDISAKFWNTTVTSLKDVANVSKEVSKSIPNIINSSKQGLYKFGEGLKNTEKLYKAKNLKKSVSSITKYVEQSGNSVAKVMGNTLKVFYKSNGKVNSIYMNATKNLKSIPQKFKKAMDTIAFFNRNTSDMIDKYDWSDDVISHIRMIEESFGRVKFGRLSGGIQDYLRGVLGKFEELNPAIRQISKSLGGTYNIFSKNSKVVAATADSLISLGAVLYNGSDAANEYATNMARLEFLYEHGEATWEEVEEARVGYLERIKDALLEYKQALDETYMKEVDFFSAFNKNALDENVNLMENLFSQISGYYTYGEMLTELSRRLPALGESTQLMKMFADAGVDSFGKLQKVLEMNQEELNAYIYGISVLNKTQEETSNKALAAMANATSYAAKRQQAVDKDVLQKTTKYSENVRKAIISDMEAVAQATVEYNKISKKEEKAYLKTLTAEEKKYYKQRKKYYKEAKKAYDKQKASQEEKAYAKQLVENIKTFKDYLEALNKYAGDAKANASLTNMLADAFGDLVKNANDAGVALSVTDENLLRFADTLDSTGQDGLNYFEEMAARIQNFVNDIKSAITNVNILTTAFEKTAAVKFSNIYDNILSNLIGGDNIISALSELSSKGYNSEVLNKVKAVYDSNRSEGLELIKAMNKASAEDVKRTNTAMDALNISAESEANLWVKILSSAGKTKEQLDTAANIALTNLTKATETRAAKEAEIAELEKQQAKTNSDISKLQKTIKKKGKTDARTTKLANLRAELSKNQAAIAKARKELEALQQAEAAAQKAHNDAVAELNNYTAKLNTNLESIKKDKAVKQWYETCIKAQKKLSEMIGETTKGSKEYIRVLQMATELSNSFPDTIAHYNLDGIFENIKGMDLGDTPFQNIVDGLYNFGATLVDISDSIDDFDERCVKALTEYKNSLKDAIKQSSDFFNMFKGFADEDNPLQATDYLEYADSQINALETWMSNLEKLTDLGLDKELVEKLASQGLGSYEIVNAFAKATASQIGEYNAQWKKYNETIAKATESAFTDIAASWSTAGQALSESMIKYFGENGADRLKEAGYEASAMVITGVKDGLTEAMPSIISAVEHTDTSSMSKALGKSVGQGINTGLVEAISGSVNETVNTVIEKFKMAVDSVLAYATEVIPTDFTITVHVDTSEIDAAVARMNQAIYATNISANETSNAVDTSNANREVVETVPTEPVGNTINLNYVQNNNSPKELDQVTIYRNTQNQLNAFKSVQELAGT